MTDVTITRLMNNLRIALPGAIDDAIKLEVYNALNDFFQDSNIWTEDISIPVVAGQTSYVITPAETASITRLMGLVDGNQITVACSMDTPGTVVLWTTPSTSDTYTAKVSLTINDPLDGDNYPTFPYWVLNKYQNDIIDGVLGRMMAQPAKPYSNIQLAAFHTRAFRNAIANARQEANRRNIYRGQRWQFPQTFNRNKARR